MELQIKNSAETALKKQKQYQKGEVIFSFPKFRNAFFYLKPWILFFNLGANKCI